MAEYLVVNGREGADEEPDVALGRTHGPPEVIGEELCKSLDANPVDGWAPLIANEEARGRFVDRNLALAFGDADKNSPVYEERRAAEILEITEGRKLVLDIHDCPVSSRGDFVALGENSDPRLLGVAALLGIRNVIVYRKQIRLTELRNNVLLIELGRGKNNELVEQNVERLRECMGKVAMNGLPWVESDNFHYFDLVREVSTKEAKRAGIHDMARIEPFDTIPRKVIAALGAAGIMLPPSHYKAGYWNGESSSPDWFGEVFEQTKNPFSVDA